MISDVFQFFSDFEIGPLIDHLKLVLEGGIKKVKH